MSLKRRALHRALFERKSDPPEGGGGGGEGDPSPGTVVAEIKTLIAKQSEAWTEFKKVNDERLAKLAKGEAVAEIEQKLQKIGADLDLLSKSKEEVEKTLTRLQKMGLGVGGSDPKSVAEFEAERKATNLMRKSGPNGNAVTELDADGYRAYKSGCEKMLRKGMLDSLNEAERKAMLAGDDPNGGFFLPAPTVGRIVARQFELSPIRGIVNVQTISTNALEGINDNDEAAAGWVGEVEARPDTNTPKVGRYRLEAFEMYAQPKASQTLLDDAAVDIEGWLSGKVASKFARLEGAAFVSGTGAGQPRGFTTYPMATTDDDSRAWGTIQYVKTGTNGGFGTNADVLFDLIAAFRQPYLQNAGFATRREVVAALRKLKGAVAGDYLWQPGLQQGQPDRLLGYPITIAQDLPALSANSFSLWLADWKEFYTVVDRIGIRVLRDPFTDKPNVKLYTTKRVGGGVLNYEAGKAVQFAT